MMDLEPGDSRVYLSFQKLVKACQEFFVKPSLENLNIVKEVGITFEPIALGRLLHIVVVPLAANLSIRERLACDIVECFYELVKRSSICELDVFLNIYVPTIRILQRADSPEFVRETSEELKLAVLKCITELVKRSSPDVRHAFICRKYYSKLSVGVFICIQIAKTETYAKLKVEALNCLLYLTHVAEELPFDEAYKKDLVEVLMLMIPGICSACLYIVNHGETQNHLPAVLAVRLWGRLVGTVLSMNSVEYPPTTFKLNNTEHLSSGATSKELFNDPNEYIKNLNEIKLDKKWIKSVDEKLAAVTKMIIKCQNHHHWKVRLELSCQSHYLLSNCGINIEQSVGELTETLVFLSQDENKSVSNFCKNSILELGANFDEMSDRRLVEIVEESFYSLLTRLPRIFQGVDITLKERQLTLIGGFLDILGSKHVPGLLRSSQHFDRFLYCLIKCATPDCGSVTLMEEVAIRGIDMDNHSFEPKWRRLKHCESVKCEDNLKHVCAKLVQYSELDVILNSLIDLINTDRSCRKNVVLLFVLLFSSDRSQKLKIPSSLLKDLVSTLMESTLWNVPVDVNEEVTSRSVIQENIVQICLLAEAIGCLSEAAGPTVFLPLLLQCLYPILECAGSPLTMISCAGQLSLKKLAKLYPDGCMSTLIKNNVDYLSHHVMLKLRQVHKNPRVLSVLSVIMQHSSLDSLSSLHDIVKDVLIQSCDMLQDINRSAFLDVFHTYLLGIKVWTNTGGRSANQDKPVKQKPMIVELLEYKESQTLGAETLQCDEPASDCNPDISQLMGEQEEKINAEEKEVKLPDHVTLTRDIVLKSLHFLPGNNIPRQIKVLQTIQEGVEILNDWTDVLLPVVHKVWSPFVERFKTSSDAVLLQRAFSLLQVLAQLSKDFIRSRTVKEVFPCLCKILKTDSYKNNEQNSPDVYAFTQMYKLKLQLLSGLGNLASDLDVLPRNLYPLLVAATPYLSAKQPSPLQEACMQFFSAIGRKYPDLIWLHLMSVCPNQLEFKAPLEGMQDYKFESTAQNKEEYFDVVDKLLTSL